MNLIFILLLTIVFFLENIVKRNERWNTFRVYVYSLIMVFISGFRSVDFATDTRQYLFFYELLPRYSYKNIIDGAFTVFEKDPVFYLLSKFIQDMGVSHRGWLFIIAIVFFLTIGYFISRNSEDIFISFLSFASLGFFYFSMTGLRQTVALSFIIISSLYLDKRKVVPFTAFVLIGSLFHSTALVFLIAYPLYTKKLNLRHLISLVILIAIINLNPSLFKRLIEPMLGSRFDNYFINTSMNNLSGFFIQLSIFSFAWLRRKKFTNKYFSSLLTLTFIGLFLQGLSPIIAEFFRISMYFSIFNIVLIPATVNTYRNTSYFIPIKLFVTSILIFYLYHVGTFNQYVFDFYFLQNRYLN